MSVYIITCPLTGHAVSTGVEAIEEVLPKIALKPARMICPACGASHEWMPLQARVGEERDTWVITGKRLLVPSR